MRFFHLISIYKLKQNNEKIAISELLQKKITTQIHYKLLIFKHLYYM